MATWGLQKRERKRGAPAQPPEVREAILADRIVWSNKVRDLREALGLPQTVFAQRMGRTRGVVASWEGAASKPLEADRKLLAQLAADAGVPWEG